MRALPDPETRIRQAIDDVLSQATATFLDIDEDQFTALSYVIHNSVMAEIRRSPEGCGGGHVYLSTGCHHGHEPFAHGLTGHEYCQNRHGVLGDKKPARCKGETCHAPCICPCHTAARDLDLTDKDALRAWMEVRREPGRIYPETTETFAATQRERLLSSLGKEPTDDQPDAPADQ